MVTPAATIVIPNFNGLRFLPRLMESFAAQSDPRGRVLVVDDVSSDDSVRYLREHWPQVQVIENETNLGFAGTCNVGMRAADTPFVVLLNNDTHLDRDWLAEGLRPFDDPRVGAVASLVLLAEEPHPIDTAGDVFSVAGGAVKRGHLAPRETADLLDGNALSACGASAFYRREAVEKVGYLDESFQSYYEDVDLGLRLAWAGYRCVFAPKSICFHHLSSSYSPTGWRYHYNSARNAEIVWWADLPSRLRLRYLPAHLCFLGLQAANKLRQGCLRPYLAGKFASLGCRSVIRRKREEIRRYATASPAEIAARLRRDWWRLHVTSRFNSLQTRGG